MEEHKKGIRHWTSGEEAKGRGPQMEDHKNRVGH